MIFFVEIKFTLEFLLSTVQGVADAAPPIEHNKIPINNLFILAPSIHCHNRNMIGLDRLTSNTIPYKYLVSSEALSFFNSRHIDEEMVIPF
ncbi:protein of unknown function [Shewanella benthica]|uniref:Uncharacterized protein n=1 Tax=Shewanella benthica TaxID=43661 RepID=A0A330M2W6_9GAMM|nr:protein of unknown function [Shewanella benthica]